MPHVPAPINVPPPECYITPDSLYTLLEPAAEGKPAPVRLLDSRWVLERADALAAAATDAERERLALPRRQELERRHPEAYLGVEEVRALPTGWDGALAVGAVSHAWLEVSHPDPRGEQLVRIAALIRKAQGGKLRRQQPAWDVDPTIPPYQPLPARVGLFFDWASICQHQKAADGSIAIERTADEEAAFRAALESMQIWYVHQKLFAILVTDLPATTWAPATRRRARRRSTRSRWRSCWRRRSSPRPRPTCRWCCGCTTRRSSRCSAARRSSPSAWRAGSRATASTLRGCSPTAPRWR
mmetsp:Transcript_18068/g.52355  ORF Transcript_18068/g.52355 Transcript_18068/m.52355 type:complete len:299 (+) Transcript_18068:98-994(+)